MKHNVHKLIGQKLSNSSVCYVLITCEEASEDGNMKVEMSHRGEEALVSFLLQGAQTAIDELILGEEGEHEEKILSIGGS